MGLSVPFNGDLSLVASLDAAIVSGVYGRENSKSDGGGRASQHEFISEETLREAIKICRQKGISFGYVFNSPFAHLGMFTPKEIGGLDQKIRWIEEIGADLIIVAGPALLMKYKPRTNLRFGISKFHRTKTLAGLQYLIGMGADRVCLDLNVTRNFSMLDAMQKNFP